MPRRFDITKRLISLWAAKGILCFAFFSAEAVASSLSLSYSGRLTRSDGAPLEGPVVIQAKFWDASTDGRQMGNAIEYPAINLNSGVFTLELALSPDQVTAIFGDGSTPVYIEITSQNITYPRQQFSYVPFALRVPVDSKTLAFDGDGKLSLSLTTKPGANQFLTKDGDGKLVWGTPATATIQNQTIATGTPSSGQVLTYNGNQWVASASSGPNLSADQITSGTLNQAQLPPAGTPGTYAKVTTDAYGRVTAGTSLVSGDVTSALSFTPINKAGDTMGGALSLGSYDLSSAGNIQMAPSKTLTLSDNIADPSGLLSTDKGKTWFNSTTNQIKYWDGSVAIALGVAGSGLSSFNGQSGNTQALGVPGASGFAPAWVSSANTHTLNIPLASAASVTAGVISNADYNTFNSKVAGIAAGSGVSVSSTGNIATVNLANAGTAGTYAKVTTDTYGRIIAGTTLSAADIPPLSAALITSGTLNSAQLPTAGTAGSYVKVTTDAYGRVTSGTTLVSGDVTSALGFTPINKAGDTMGGALNLGSYDLSNSGNIQMAASKTLTLSGNATDPSGLVSVDKGKTWFNTTSNQIKYWDGTTAQVVGAVGSALTSLNNQTGTAQTLAVPGTSGTSPAWVSSVNTHTLNIPLASMASVTAGLLSNADYNAFNAKVAGVTSGSGISVSTTGNIVTVNLASAGTAGTYAKVSTDAYGRVTSGTTLSAGDLPPHSAALITSGALAASYGGTGLTAAPASGQIPIGNGTGYTLANITGGSGITVTNSAGGITVGNTVDPATKVAKSGDTMSGVLTLPANGLVAGTSQLVLSDGNVGIGTTAPSTLLSVAGTTSIGSGALTAPNLPLNVSGAPGAPASTGNVQSNGSLRIGTNTGNTSVLDIGEYNASPYGTWFQSSNSGALNSPYPIVLQPNGGNVGIGTTAPNNNLNLYVPNSQSPVEAMSIDVGSFSNPSNSAASYYFRVRDIGAGPVTPFIIAGTGNVGIGTTAPAMLLDVSGSSAISNGIGLRLFNSSGTNTNQWFVGTGGNTVAPSAFSIGDNSAYRLVINNGNVGVGTTAPTNTLDVNGGITASGGVGTVIFSTQPASRFNGIAVASTWYLTGESLAITVPAGPSRRYRIVMRQMLYNLNSGQAIVALSTNSSSMGVGTSLVVPYQAITGYKWSTVSTESYVTLSGGTTTTYYVWVNYEMTPSGPSVANESSSNRIYCDLFAVQM